MKKLLFVAAVASAFGLFAADEGVQDGTQVLEVGITAITSPLENTVIAISYENLEGGVAKADHLVKTTNLTLGDQLVAFDGSKQGVNSKGVYYGWTLLPDKEGRKVWTAGLDNGDSDDDIKPDDQGQLPAEYPVTYGSGIWLCRQNVKEEVKDEGEKIIEKIIPFYIYGKPSTETSIEVPAGMTVLVGNPTTSNKRPTIIDAKPGDTILIPSATIPTQVKCALVDKTNPDGEVKWGGFGINKIPEINANTGFWYISAAAGGKRTISWQ